MPCRVRGASERGSGGFSAGGSGTPGYRPAASSRYESGKREPPLAALLGYARAAGVPVEVLIDDDYELPEDLPAGSWVMGKGGVWRRRR